jgi:hypothetical protein
MHSTSNLNDGYIGSGKKLKRSIKKYGIENFKFEILEYLPCRLTLANREKEIVNESLLSDPLCMNLKLGGFGGGGIWNEAHKKSFSEAGKANIIRFKEKRQLGIRLFNEDLLRKQSANRKISEKLKINPSLGFLGKLHSDETKKLWSISRKNTGTGKSNSQHGTCWITKEGINKKIKIDSLHEYQLIGWSRGRV